MCGVGGGGMIHDWEAEQAAVTKGPREQGKRPRQASCGLQIIVWAPLD